MLYGIVGRYNIRHIQRYGDSVRILRDGRIEVGFSEDGMLTALFEEGNQNKNKCSVKNAALVGYHQKLCGGSYLCGIRNC